MCLVVSLLFLWFVRFWFFVRVFSFSGVFFGYVCFFLVFVSKFCVCF